MSHRYVLALALAVVAGACGSSPTRVRLRAPIEVTPEHVEIHAQCSNVTRELACEGRNECVVVIAEQPIDCPDHEIELDARGGRSAVGRLSPDGEAVIAIHGTPERPIVAEELSLKRTHSYRRAMIAGDLAVLAVGGVFVLAGMADDNPELFLAAGSLGAVGYHVVAPIIHARNDNRRGAGLSLLRRVLTTAGAIAFFSAGVACGDDVGECGADRDAIHALAWIVPLPLNILLDLAAAEVEHDLPMPSISASHEGAVVGLGGRF